MREEKQLTGYPSIDKPWLKYYREEPIRSFDVKQNTWQLVYEANKNNLDSNALNFMGVKGNSWTYRELFSLTDRLADAFIKQTGGNGGEVTYIIFDADQENMEKRTLMA